MIDYLKARIAAQKLKTATSEEKNRAIRRISAIISENAESIEHANALDVAAAKSKGVPEIMLDRLSYKKERILSSCADALKICDLPDPVGEVTDRFVGAKGIEIEKIRVPFGVIGAIYESRPNVTIDIAVLCLKTGNACLLKGGADAENTNKTIAGLIEKALSGFSFCGAVTLLDSSRETVNELITARGKVDLVVPRGGKGLIEYVVTNATVPVIETGAGVCHVYIEKTADKETALNVLLNAKISRPSVCNSAETVLVDRSIAKDFLPVIKNALERNGVIIRGDESVSKYIDVEPLTEDGYKKEYNALEISAKVVDGVDEAIAHINEYGTHHSEAIITSDKDAADRFCSLCDSACCYVNASTRWTDGGCFGFGAELGISTQKMHARGPMGLKEMTSYHYVIKGNGQVR